MTPTTEEIAIAARISDDRYRRGSPSWHGAREAALTALMEVRAWRPSGEAPKDGTYIFAVVDENDSRHLGHQAGRIFCIKHEGITSGGYDMGWAVYPEFGGCPDHYFAGWLPCPPLSSATGII